MRGLLLVLLSVGLVLSGCGEQASRTTATVVGATPKTTAIQVPKFVTGPKTLVLSGTIDVSLGLRQTETFKSFANLESANHMTDLPPPLRGLSGFTAASRQSGVEGFGVVMYEDKVCLAEHQIDHQTADQ